ncbi:outer membrane beta-barrel protein [bacterium]|nr:outer membrane beta-barrel protein [bacterium]
MKRSCAVLLALGLISTLALAPMTAQAQDDYLALYNRYLFHHVGLSARSAAMGGAYTALKGGDMGFTGNPASLGFQTERYVSLEGGFEDVTSDSSLDIGGLSDVAFNDTEIWDVGAGLIYPFEWGALALNYNYREDDLETNDYYLLGTRYQQDGSLERHSVSLGGGYAINECFTIGYRYSYIDWDRDTSLIDVGAFVPSTIATINEDFQGHRNQFGVQYEYGENWRFGFDGMYGLGDRDIKGMGSADADSWHVRGGLAYDFADYAPLVVTLDLNYENRELDGAGQDTQDDLLGVHFGAEYEVYENLFLRAGYQWEDIDYEDNANSLDEEIDISGFSGGLGYEWNQISLDYGIMYLDTGGEGDLMHVFGIGYRF